MSASLLLDLLDMPNHLLFVFFISQFKTLHINPVMFDKPTESSVSTDFYRVMLVLSGSIARPI